MKKSELAKLLAAKTEEFQTYGGEVVRYASPMHPNPIKLGAPPALPENLRDAEWQKYLEELKAGTYVPDKDYQEPVRRIDSSRDQYYKPAKKHGPQWRGSEDGRGWKNK